jgi:hypothetical protein
MPLLCKGLFFVRGHCYRKSNGCMVPDSDYITTSLGEMVASTLSLPKIKIIVPKNYYNIHLDRIWNTTSQERMSPPKCGMRSSFTQTPSQKPLSSRASQLLNAFPTLPFVQGSRQSTNRRALVVSPCRHCSCFQYCSKTSYKPS